MKHSARPNLIVWGGLATALLASTWSWLAGSHCEGCAKSAQLVGDLNLGLAGTLFYAAALALLASGSFRPGPTATPQLGAVRAAVLLAAGIHLALGVLLVRYGALCPPCILAAVGAWTAAGAWVFRDRRFVGAAATLLLVGAVIGYGGSRTLRGVAESRFTREARKAERQLLQNPGLPPEGQVRLVVYVRDTCHWCHEFRRKVLGPLAKRYGSRLALEERPAWEGMGTPTTVILARRSHVLIGYQPFEKMAAAVDQVVNGASAVAAR